MAQVPRPHLAGRLCGARNIGHEGAQCG
jgi:hypothetical protein